MFDWFRRKRQTTLPRIAPGQRVYAIGDIHGCHDLLCALLDRIEADRTDCDCARIVFLGDYIDRGPASAQVLAELMAYRPAQATVTYLRGNHEDALLRLLTDEDLHPRHIRLWLDNGGREALTSWGIPTALAYGGDEAAIRDALKLAVPSAQRAFLEATHFSHRIDDYLFVHAGIAPGVPLDAQKPADMMWIREDFLNSNARHGAMIVHGHSISPTVVERANRIGIDTGAYATGCLTALVLEADRRRTLSTCA